MHENILVIEDNALDRKIVCNLLEKEQFITIESKDAYEALEKIEENKIDLILLDVKLPRCSGFELLKRLGNYCSRNNVPVIMMSATRLDKNGVLQAFKYGASDFLVKPIQADALFEKIQKLKDAEKIKQRIKAKLPDGTMGEVTTSSEIIYLEEYGVTIDTSTPYTEGEVIIFNSPFFMQYGIEDLKVLPKNREEVGDSYHQFLSFQHVDQNKIEKIQSIYSELVSQTQKNQENNFRGDL